MNEEKQVRKDKPMENTILYKQWAEGRTLKRKMISEEMSTYRITEREVQKILKKEE